MEPDSQKPLEKPEPGAPPPPQPPIIGSAGLPQPAVPHQNSASNRKVLDKLLVNLLSVCLGFFLADGIASLADDTWVLLFDVHGMMTVRVIVFLLAILLAMVVYWLMAITPMIPKQVFVPVTLFSVIAQLVVIPFYIYDYRHVQSTNWGISLIQLVCAVGVVCWLQGGFKIRWPLVAENQLKPLRFSWLNLCLFLGINAFVLLPVLLGYLWVCATLAVDHFSDSFMALRPRGFTVQVRTYVRDDGKRIELVPMAHIGEPEFYRALSRSFSSDALILMEGVTDARNLLTNKISYRRAAASLGLAEQQREFKPRRERVVRADVDVEEFAPSTIALLNEAMLIHTRGLNPATLSQLMEYSPPPHFEEHLIEDLLRKRNRHLLEEIHKQLPDADELIVPWGVAHMPEIAKAIQKDGFRLKEKQDYVAIRFGSRGRQSTP